MSRVAWNVTTWHTYIIAVAGNGLVSNRRGRLHEGGFEDSVTLHLAVESHARALKNLSRLALVPTGLSQGTQDTVHLVGAMPFSTFDGRAKQLREFHPLGLGIEIDECRFHHVPQLAP